MDSRSADCCCPSAFRRCYQGFRQSPRIPPSRKPSAATQEAPWHDGIGSSRFSPNQGHWLIGDSLRTYPTHRNLFKRTELVPCPAQTETRNARPLHPEANLGAPISRLAPHTEPTSAL